ncbi:MAG: DUF2299 family protein [Methanotrichaceae archaeon]|nr:DUF2299 family protein [Methanotrichaceae archaeon]
MPRTEIDDVMRKIKNWLLEESLFKEQIVDEQANYHYLLVFPANSGMGFRIVQPKAKDDSILVLTGINLDEKHYQAINSMPKAKRDELLWDIRFELLFKLLDFTMMPSAEDVKAMNFSRDIFFDGLTKNYLMEVIREGFRCNLFIIWKMNQLFGELPPPSHAQPQMYV